MKFLVAAVNKNESFVVKNAAVNKNESFVVKNAIRKYLICK